MLAILGRFSGGFARLHGLYQAAVALNESRLVISSRYAETLVAGYKRVSAIAAGWKQALGYCRAARRDEKNRFPLTAAMEWRQAAELFCFVPMARRRCWGEWERIMHLPRRLATPIFAGDVITFQGTPVSNCSKMPATAVKDALSARQRDLGEEGASRQLEISWHNPVPPRKVKNSGQKVASKNISAACAILGSKPEEEFQLLDGAA